MGPTHGYLDAPKAAEGLVRGYTEISESAHVGRDCEEAVVAAALAKRDKTGDRG